MLTVDFLFIFLHASFSQHLSFTSVPAFSWWPSTRSYHRGGHAQRYASLLNPFTTTPLQHYRYFLVRIVTPPFHASLYKAVASILPPRYGHWNGQWQVFCHHFVTFLISNLGLMPYKGLMFDADNLVASEGIQPALCLTQGHYHGVNWSGHLHPTFARGVPQIDADPLSFVYIWVIWYRIGHTIGYSIACFSVSNIEIDKFCMWYTWLGNFR